MTSLSLIHRPLVFLPREKFDVSAFLIYFTKRIKNKTAQRKGKGKQEGKKNVYLSSALICLASVK